MPDFEKKQKKQQTLKDCRFLLEPAVMNGRSSKISQDLNKVFQFMTADNITKNFKDLPIYLSTTFHLPPEIMLRIFQFAAWSEGIHTFIKRASRVCHEWHQLSQDPSLYSRLDLSVDKVPLT